MSRIYLYFGDEKNIRDVYTIKSFFIVIFGENLAPLREYQVPVSALAPFANRLFREIPLVRDMNAREPWYSLTPSQDINFERSPLPGGPTSLYSKPFDPGTLPSPAIQMIHDARVRCFVVRLFDFQTELYKGVYTVDDIFLHGANYLLHEGLKRGQIPDDRGPYFYAIYPSRQTVRQAPAEALPRDAYDVEGVFHLPPRAKDEKRIIFKPVPEPPLPERDPDGFPPSHSFGKGEPHAGKIYIPSEIYEDLHQKLTLSEQNEEGGYLLGDVYRMPGAPEKEDDPDFKWIVEVTDLLMAEDTIGSPATLLFTGDTWSKMSRQIDRNYADRRLVGWFHTHVFPATDSFGLSGLDQDMHAWYLPRPWQIAVLLNLEDNGERTVRCFQKGGEGHLVETEFQVMESNSVRTPDTGDMTA